jgi:hypothetical protein
VVSAAGRARGEAERVIWRAGPPKRPEGCTTPGACAARLAFFTPRSDTFTNDDTVPNRGWLAAGAFDRDPTLAAVTGRVMAPLPPRPTDYERNEAGLEAAEFVTANCFCRRDALEAIGGFDERFTSAWREDSDLHFNLIERGLRIIKTPDAMEVHPGRPAPWGVSIGQQKKSMFDALLCTKHPDLHRRRIRRWPPLDYYCIVAALAFGAGAAACGTVWPAVTAGGVWALLTGRFLARRLHGTSRTPSHVAEMVFTSLLIAHLSVFWRLCGAAKFRVVFF